jgi:hypothetical protein
MLVKITAKIKTYLTRETSPFLPLAIKKHRPVLCIKICPVHNEFQTFDLLYKLKFVFCAGIKQGEGGIIPPLSFGFTLTTNEEHVRE